MLAIFGPTAAGKSALAHAAARALGGEIVVADPFQRYRGLEIAADSPRPRERAEIPYHLVGDLDWREASSAGSFAPRAHAAIDAALGRGRTPIVAGGTGLYLRAALADLDFPPEVPREQREEVETLVERDPPAALAELSARDPRAALGIDAHNPRRLARALALARAGTSPGRPRDRLWDGSTRHPGLLVGVVRPVAVLDRLIALRVRRELDDGLEAEIAGALAHPDLSREAAQIIGVSEVGARQRGELDEPGLERALAARTRRLARKQLTWLRKTSGVTILDLGEDSPDAALPRLLALWEEAGGARAQTAARRPAEGRID